MIPKLPYEIREMIMLHTSFHDCIINGYPYAAEKLYDPQYCYLAILNKDYKMLYLLDKYKLYKGLDRCIVHLAINSRDLKVVSIIYKNFFMFFTGQHLDLSASNGCLDIVKFLHQYVKGTTDAMDFASAHGHFDTLKWLYYNGYDCTHYALDNAAKFGHLDIVIWLHKNGKPATTMAMDNALRSGHLDILIWLHEHRKEGCTPAAIKHAVALGHFNTVQWMVEHRRDDVNLIDMILYTLKFDQSLILEYLCDIIVRGGEKSEHGRERKHTI